MGAEAQGMYRSISTQAIVIRRERLGEFHKSLTLLTSDLGLITATAYGAYKMHSHLRVGSEPFTWSSTVLYHNPVKKSYKVTDPISGSRFTGRKATSPGSPRLRSGRRSCRNPSAPEKSPACFFVSFSTACVC